MAERAPESSADRAVRLLSRYLDRAERDLGSDVRAVLMERYDMHDDVGCESDLYCEEEHREPGEDDAWRQLARDWHELARVQAVYTDRGADVHTVGSYRHCPAEKCRRAAELLGDRP